MLLGRIVYMYRAVDVLDSRSQLVIGRAQKFEANLWQQSRRALADHFGMSVNDVDDALAALKAIGVIKTELRTITVKGQRISNMLYIGLNVSILRKISTPMAPQTDSYLLGAGDLPTSITAAVVLQGKTNTEITRKTTHKNRSKTAVVKTPHSVKNIESLAIFDAIACLPLELQRDACQIAQEEAESGEEIIASNFRLMTLRNNLTGGLLRSAVRNDYAAPEREKLLTKESVREMNQADKEAFEKCAQEKDEALDREALDWCSSEEGKKFLQLFEKTPIALSEKDRVELERIQRDKLNQQRLDLLTLNSQDGISVFK